MWSVHELIVAPATVRGSGARAIVRLSGEGLERLLNDLFAATGAGFVRQGELPQLVAARLAARELTAEWGELPVELIHWPGPQGPTGGPLAEVQLPASGPLVDAVVAAACRHGARLARGGEFSLRACLAGRHDLLPAEQDQQRHRRDQRADQQCGREVRRHQFVVGAVLDRGEGDRRHGNERQRRDNFDQGEQVGTPGGHLEPPTPAGPTGPPHRHWKL